MLTDLMLAEIDRFVYYHWQWRVICDLINFRFGTSFLVAELRKSYEGSRAERSDASQG